MTSPVLGSSTTRRASDGAIITVSGPFDIPVAETAVSEPLEADDSEVLPLGVAGERWERLCVERSIVADHPKCAFRVARNDRAQKGRSDLHRRRAWTRARRVLDSTVATPKRRKQKQC